MAKSNKGAGTAGATDANKSESTATSTDGGDNGQATVATVTPKVSKKGQPVQLGKRRRLGLALRGLLAEIKAGTVNVDPTSPSPAVVEAEAALTANKYGEIRPQAELMDAVKARLEAAIAAGDGKLIASLGKAINRIKAGQAVDLEAIGRQPKALAEANAAEHAEAVAAEGADATSTQQVTA